MYVHHIFFLPRSFFFWEAVVKRLGLVLTTSFPQCVCFSILLFLSHPFFASLHVYAQVEDYFKYRMHRRIVRFYPTSHKEPRVLPFSSLLPSLPASASANGHEKATNEGKERDRDVKRGEGKGFEMGVTGGFELELSSLMTTGQVSWACVCLGKACVCSMPSCFRLVLLLLPGRSRHMTTLPQNIMIIYHYDHRCSTLSPTPLVSAIRCG